MKPKDQSERPKGAPSLAEIPEIGSYYEDLEWTAEEEEEFLKILAEHPKHQHWIVDQKRTQTLH